MTAAIGPAGDDDLRRAAWFLGGLFDAARHDAALLARAHEVLARAAQADSTTLFWVVSAFRDHLPRMDAELRRTWMSAWEELRGRPDHAIEDLDRDREVVQALTAVRDPAEFAPPAAASGRDPKAPVRVGLVVSPHLSGNSFLQPPLGMMLAATRLRQAGVEVTLLDLRAEPLTPAQVVRRLDGCSVVVVTTTPYDQVQNYFLDYRYALTVRLVRALRAGLPSRTALCVCGSHGTVRPDLVLRDCGVEMVVRGEYDVLIPRLVSALAAGEELPAFIVTPLNVAEGPVDLYRPTPQTLGCPQVEEALPAFDLIDFSQYYGDGYRYGLPYRRTGWATVLANRGGPYRCDFCFNAWGRRVRRREPGAVAQELQVLQDAHAVRAVFFIDFTFTASHDWVFEFCREYRRRNPVASCQDARLGGVVDSSRNARGGGVRHGWLTVTEG